MAFTANNLIRLNSRFSTSTEFGETAQTADKTYLTTLSNGTGANQADKQYAENISVASGATQDIDLTSVEDAFGDALGLAEVVTIALYSLPANTTNITVGGSSADFSGLPDQTIAPGGLVYLTNPSASGLGTVTNGSSDTIRLVNASGAAAMVEVYVIGRSA